MKAEIISIGDELLIGQTVNTNAAYLAKELTKLGLSINWVTTVGDNVENLRQALSQAMNRSDVVFATGGLGPTHDDITKNVAAGYFNSPLVLVPEILEKLKKAFEQRRIKWAAVNEEQALVPDKAQVLENPVGTAPGLLFEKEGKKCIILPGVPSEMRTICEQTVFPMFQGTGVTISHKTVRTTGIAESVLFERIGDIHEIEKFAKAAFLPKTSGVDIRLTVRARTREIVQERLSKALQLVLEKVGDYVYAFDNESLQDIVARLFIEKKKTVAVAESCTGGLLASTLTDVSGSSAYFERGVVAYSNRAKVDVLGVPPGTLEKFGAVSAETAEAMAEGVRRMSGADFGISTTGIAGPTGGTKEKPVGLVYIGLAYEAGSFSKRYVFFKERKTNKERTVFTALNLLRKKLI
ncbi:MAG: competence/damage-inducible protein A [bacterium]